MWSFYASLFFEILILNILQLKRSVFLIIVNYRIVLSEDDFNWRISSERNVHESTIILIYYGSIIDWIISWCCKDGFNI